MCRSTIKHHYIILLALGPERNLERVLCCMKTDSNLERAFISNSGAMMRRTTTTTAVLIFMWTLCTTQKGSFGSRTEWSEKYDADRAPPRGCSNLTLVLDNWKFAILTQVKDLLLHDHNTVLPDYGRIQTLSDALADLYKEFNTLKERLALMTSHFDTVEGFVDEMRSGRNPSSRAGAGHVGARPTVRRSRVVIRRVQKPNLR